MKTSKFNKSEIMKAAHSIRAEHKSTDRWGYWTWSQCLKQAWHSAKVTLMFAENKRMLDEEYEAKAAERRAADHTYPRTKGEYMDWYYSRSGAYQGD